ncbi:RNA polymerase sigma factor [Microlunatus sp. Y2014]|uniref:RNA polymerase sigma factor n=1 Tax=Microlunatus sp. Y2014 TaxID=3418488 RepID=UPI003DA7710B
MEAMSRAELAARSSYGRLLALLAARTGDVADAEDALGDAFERALRRWPDDGVPDNPDGWLLTVARNRLKDLWKSAGRRRTTAWDDHAEHLPDDGPDPFELDVIEDRRLELMLVCAHPAIDRSSHTALMLNTVLGRTAAEIAGAYALPTATVAGRLVRAKRRIKHAGIPFRIPDATALRPRLDAVLQAVYGAYAIEWSTGTEERPELAGEARHLGDTVAELTGDAEALGLAALINFSSARLGAGRDADGRFVPLPDQDPTRWDVELIMLGREQLHRAQRHRELGRFQLEAAIQAVHCARLDDPGRPADAAVLLPLHRALYDLAPGLGSHTALAAVVADVDGPAAGLAVLDEPPATEAGRRFQPARVTRAHLLQRLGRTDEAIAALDAAVEPTHDPAQREHLMSLADAWR